MLRIGCQWQSGKYGCSMIHQMHVTVTVYELFHFLFIIRKLKPRGAITVEENGWLFCCLLSEYLRHMKSVILTYLFIQKKKKKRKCVIKPFRMASDCKRIDNSV